MTLRRNARHASASVHRLHKHGHQDKMKSFTHFRFLLLFAIILTYYFVLHCHRAITEEEPKVIIPRPNYKVNLTTVAIPTAPWSLNEILNDYDKLREVFHVDGPLNMTGADLPVMEKRTQILYTYERPPTLSKSFTFGKPACAKSLRKVPGRSKWFNQRFLSSIKLFLDKDDINNWGSFYNLSLCPDHMMGLKNFDRLGLIRLVNNDNYSTTPITNVTSPNKCVRCAVVGNSGVLRGSKAGPEIDSYDYVFRVNTAKIKGFEEDVGSKTSFYSGFPNSVYVKELKNITDVFFICHLSGSYAVPWLEELLNGSMASKQKLSLDFISNGSLLTPRKVRVLHPDFIRYFKVRFLGGKGRFPSTGALTAGVALHVCDEIKLFGFGVTDNSFIHYYDELNSSKITNRKSQRKHNFINEWNLWQLLQRNHIINRFTTRVKKPKARGKKGKR